MTIASSMAALAALMLRFSWWSGIPEDDGGDRRPLPSNWPRPGDRAPP